MTISITEGQKLVGQEVDDLKFVRNVPPNNGGGAIIRYKPPGSKSWNNLRIRADEQHFFIVNKKPKIVTGS